MTLEDHQKEIVRLRRVLGSLIAWIAQSAASPLSRADAKELLRMLESDTDD